MRCLGVLSWAPSAAGQAVTPLSARQTAGAGRGPSAGFRTAGGEPDGKLA